MGLKGITFNGIPLTIQETFRLQKTDPEVKELLKAGKMKGQLYHTPVISKCKTYRERNGKPMSLPMSKLHEENLHAHFHQDKRVRSQIVALLLAGKTVSVNTLPDMIQEISKEQHTSHSIRAHMNILKKSVLGDYIERKREEQEHTPYKAWCYTMTKEVRDDLSFKEAIELAFKHPPTKKSGFTVKEGDMEPPKEQPPGKFKRFDPTKPAAEIKPPAGIELNLTDEDGTPTINIRGEFHFYFHFGGA